MFIAMNAAGYICGTGVTEDEARWDAVHHWAYHTNTQEERAEYGATMLIHPATKGLAKAVNQFGGDFEEWPEFGLTWKMNDEGVFYLVEKMEM
jgi:hypothetical protein